MLGPDAIDHHAGGEWIIGAGDGAGQFKTATAVLEWFTFLAGDQLQVLARNLLAFVGGIPTAKNTGILLNRLVFERDGVTRRSCGAGCAVYCNGLQPFSGSRFY